MNWTLSGCFMGESSLKSQSGGLWVAVIFFQHKHSEQWAKVIYRRQMLFFGQNRDEESVGQVGGQMLLCAQLRYFFASHSLLKTVTVTMLLLFDHVTLLCGTFFFILLSEGSVKLSDGPVDMPSLRAAGLSIHTGLICQFCAQCLESSLSTRTDS